MQRIQEWLDGPLPRLSLLLSSLALFVCAIILAFLDRAAGAGLAFGTGVICFAFLFLSEPNFLEGLGIRFKARSPLQEPMLVTSGSRPKVVAAGTVQQTVKKGRKQTQKRNDVKIELTPNARKVVKGETVKISCCVSAASAEDDTALAGLTLALLWNIHELDYVDTRFSDELGDPTQSHRTTTVLDEGVCNPADPEFAAVVFGNYSDLSQEELTELQSASPVIAVFTFRALTDGPIRINAGFPFAAGSLIDLQRRPTFDAEVSALFLNEPGS